MNLVKYNREIWQLAMENKTLQEILSDNSELWTKETSFEEKQFLKFIFLHLSSSYHLLQAGSLIAQEGLADDIKGLSSTSNAGALLGGKQEILQQQFRQVRRNTQRVSCLTKSIMNTAFGEPHPRIRGRRTRNALNPTLLFRCWEPNKSSRRRVPYVRL